MEVWYDKFKNDNKKSDFLKEMKHWYHENINAKNNNNKRIIAMNYLQENEKKILKKKVKNLKKKHIKKQEGSYKNNFKKNKKNKQKNKQKNNSQTK